MLDNTIITKFELSEREKILKKQFFQREEDLGKNYLFSRPKEKEINLFNNNSNLMNNSHSLSLEQNINQSNNLKININKNKLINNEEDKSIQNQNLSNTIPDIKKITKEEMDKFYEEAGNYLPKSKGGFSSEQVNLLLHQNKIMQRNVDALQETNRSLQDFIIYTMKKDSLKNNLKEEQKKEEKNIDEYNKLNQILTPLYEHINNLQSQVKELNQKKREDEIKIDIDDLIIKDQKNFKPKHEPISQTKGKYSENDKNEKIMMKTLSSLKGTMTNLSQEMRKIGSTFNEKMQKVLEDSEKDKLKKIIGVRARSTTNKNRSAAVKKNLDQEQSSNINIFKENTNQIESILTSKLDNIDYNSFKNDLIDIGKMQEEIINDYKSKVPEFIELKKPKSKIKFSYNLFPDNYEKENKKNGKKMVSKPKQRIINEHKVSKDSKIDEKVSTAIKKEIKSKNKKIDEQKDNKKEKMEFNSDPNKKVYINNSNQEMDNKDYENKMKELNGLSVVDRMNMYKERMAEQSRKLEEDNKKYNQNSNNKNLKDINQISSLNDIGSNHSGVTLQKFNKPSQNPIEVKQKNKMKYNPPKVEYGIFGNQNEIPDNNENNRSYKIINPILPKPENLNNMIKNTIDNYLAAAFSNLKPSEAPKINLNNESNIKSPQKNEIQRVFEKEYIVKNIKEIQNIPQPVVINPPEQSQNNEQNNKLIEKFTNLAEKFTNLEEKITKQIYEQKSTIDKKIEIIEKKEKQPSNIQPSSPKKQVILPNTDLISKLVIEKIKSKINVDENYNINNSNKKSKKKKKEINIKQKEEERKEDKIDILDINQNIKNEELDDMIRMPHKINLAEYEVSQTSSYLSESLQNNNFNFNNNNNQININKIKMNIQEYEYNSQIDENKNNNNNINNSKSIGEIESDNENSSQKNDNNKINNNMNKNLNNVGNKNDINLLNIKIANEKLQNNINILENNQNNNKYNDFMNFLNNNENQNNNKINSNLNPFQNDDFFNDSGEN